MNINFNKNDGILNIALEGRLDTTTAPEFEVVVDETIPEADDIILNFEKLDYISSAGLRVIMKAQKAMSQKKGMKLINVNDDIMEVFDITGFVDILTIE